jgi:hypothetical protein
MFKKNKKQNPCPAIQQAAPRCYWKKAASDYTQSLCQPIILARIRKR